MKSRAVRAAPCMPRPKEMAMTPAPTSPLGHMPQALMKEDSEPLPRESANLVLRSASFR